MKNFVYIISTGENRMLHVGYCRDILKTIKFYKTMPNLFNPMEGFTKLVYVEEHPNDDSCLARFNELNSFPNQIKEIIIESVNPEYIDLKPGLNFELI